jgi:hypothetical protein
MARILGTIASSIFEDLGDFESIATVSVGSGGTSTITFSSIPATFTHLQIRALAKTNYTTYLNDNFIMRFNGDTGSNYNSHNLYASGSAVFSQAVGTQTFMYISYVLGTDASTADRFTGQVIDILDYTSSNKNKTVRYISGGDINGSGGSIVVGSGLWFATPATVNSISIAPGDGTSILQYSHLALYGIRGA